MFPLPTFNKHTQERLCTLKDNKKISKELREISKEKSCEMKQKKKKRGIYILSPQLPEHLKGSWHRAELQGTQLTQCHQHKA